MKKNILFISIRDLRRNTSSNLRNIGLISALHMSGYKITALFYNENSKIDSSLSKALFDNCDDILFAPNVDSNVRNNTASQKHSSGFFSFIKKIAINLYSFFFTYDVYQLRINKMKHIFKTIDLNQFDFIITSSDPKSSHKLALKSISKKVLANKWIQYWGDPMSHDVSSRKLLPFMNSHVERKLIRKSFLTLYTNPGCANYMKERYSESSNKIKWIPTTSCFCDYGNGSEIVDICYVGDYLSQYRNISPFYNSCIKLGLNCIIAGGTDVKLQKTNNVSIFGRVSRGEASSIESKSRILVIIDNNIVGNDLCLQVPGKVYHYSQSNKYVLFISNSKKIKEYYGKYNRFIFCDNEEASIISAIKSIEQGDFSKEFKEPLEEFSPTKIGYLFDLLLSGEKYA